MPERLREPRGVTRGVRPASHATHGPGRPTVVASHATHGPGRATVVEWPSAATSYSQRGTRREGLGEILTRGAHGAEHIERLNGTVALLCQLSRDCRRDGASCPVGVGCVYSLVTELHDADRLADAALLSTIDSGSRMALGYRRGMGRRMACVRMSISAATKREGARSRWRLQLDV